MDNGKVTTLSLENGYTKRINGGYHLFPKNLIYVSFFQYRSWIFFG